MLPDHWQPLLRYTIRRLRLRYPHVSVSELEDAAHDGLVNACMQWDENRVNGDRESVFTGFAIRHMKSAARVAVRRIDTTPLTEDNAGYAQPSSEVGCVRDALAALPDLQRYAITMKIDGYSWGEIATALSCSKNQVKRLLHRARAAIRAILSESEL